MASSPRLRSLSLEAMPDLPEEVAPLVEQLNGFVSDAGLAFDALLREQDPGYVLKKVTLTAPDVVWTSPTLLNSYVDYGGSYGPPAYVHLPDGSVMCRGAVKNGTPGSPILRFPSGPPVIQYFPTIVGTGIGALALETDGDLYSDTAYAAGVTYISLDPVRFRPVTPTPPTAPTTNGWPLSVSHGYTTVTGVEAVKAVCTSNPSDLYGSPTFDWVESSRGKILLRNVYGLVAGRTYAVTLKISGT